MIEQQTPIEEIKGLETLIDHFKEMYGAEFLQTIKEHKFTIGISLTPTEAVLEWHREQVRPPHRERQNPDYYELKAARGRITGYKFDGRVWHLHNNGNLYVPCPQTESGYVSICIVCDDPALYDADIADKVIEKMRTAASPARQLAHR